MYIGSNQTIVNDNVESLAILIVPLLKTPRPFAPMRFIAENLGMDVEYLSEDETVILKGRGILAEIKIGDNTITINGKPQRIDEQNESTKTFIHKGRTYLPIRALGEAVGKQVFYERGLIIISDDVNAKDENIDEMIERLNSLMVVGDMENLKSLLEGSAQGAYYNSAKGTAVSAEVRESAMATGGAPAPAPAPAPAEFATNEDYSKTNIQVEGVDEADIVKTDGDYIYYINRGKLVITK